jgi:Spy/CpxP family protein refolding chaperone
MKTKFLAVRVALLALILCGTAALSYAQGPEGPGGPGFEGHNHGGFMMMRELNLTDAQMQQVKALMKAQHQSTRTVGQQLEQIRIAMLQATANGAFDQAKIQTLAAQKAQLEAQMAVQHEALKHQIYTTILTPEQRTKADQLRTEEINRMNEHVQKMAQAPAEPPAE